MYAVTRQKYWGVDEEQRYVVEIVEGGLDYCNPDALVPKYSGEFCEYIDPLEALKVAIQIAKEWKQDSQLPIHISIGSTMGFTLPFEPQTIEEMKQKVQQIYEQLPKCAYCKEIVEDEDNNKYVTDDKEEFYACCEEHADMYHIKRFGYFV